MHKMQWSRELLLLLPIFSIILFLLHRLVVSPFLGKTKAVNSSSQVFHNTLSSVKELLSSVPSRIPIQLHERASANTRLRPFLGLTNTFVDPRESIHNSFRKHSALLLKNVQTIGWGGFHDVCTTAVRSTFMDYQLSLQDDIEFDKFVQIVVLRTIISSLLSQGQSAEDLGFDSLKTVSSNINLLWTLSKSSSSPPSHLFQQLHEHLRILLPPSTTGFTNPIDFVVPTWETTWRVCATTVAHAQESIEYRKEFEEFYAAEQFSVTDFDSVRSAGWSIRNFVDEVMRLHPPVKHIARSVCPLMPTTSDDSGKSVLLRCLQFFRKWMARSGNPQSIHHVADVHSALRSEPIWFSDAKLFKPERHQEPMIDDGIATDRKDSLKLVFGWGSLRCIASAWAPNAVAVISSTIIGECRQLGWEVVVGEKIGGREGWDGWKLVKSPMRE